MGFKSFRGGGFVSFAGGLVETEFDDRDIGVGRRKVIVQFGLGEAELDLVEGFEGVAEVNEDEVALVAELGEESRADGGVGAGAFEGLKRRDGLGGDAVAVGGRGGAPCLPVEAEELVEQAVAFKGKRDWGKVGQREHLE